MKKIFKEYHRLRSKPNRTVGIGFFIRGRDIIYPPANIQSTRKEKFMFKHCKTISKARKRDLLTLLAQ